MVFINKGVQRGIVAWYIFLAPQKYFLGVGQGDTRGQRLVAIVLDYISKQGYNIEYTTKYHETS